MKYLYIAVLMVGCLECMLINFIIVILTVKLVTLLLLIIKYENVMKIKNLNALKILLFMLNITSFSFSFAIKCDLDMFSSREIHP